MAKPKPLKIRPQFVQRFFIIIILNKFEKELFKPIFMTRGIMYFRIFGPQIADPQIAKVAEGPLI